jgi:hypothetical protein
MPAVRLSTRLRWAHAEDWTDRLGRLPSFPWRTLSRLLGRYTGKYAQLRLERELSPNATASAETLHFAVGDAVKQAGGRDSGYLGVELKLMW